jgi:hypothetical protein
MADVFIGYDRRNAALAEQVVNALSEAGLTVFRDLNISTGESWLDRIEHEIRAAKCFVALWTRESCQSMAVRSEAREAHRLGILLSVKCDAVDLPLEFDVVRGPAIVDWNTQSPDALAVVVSETRKFIESRSSGKRTQIEYDGDS